MREIFQGGFSISYNKILDLTTSYTASSLFSDIKSYFDAHSVPLSNIIGLGTGGATYLCGAHCSVYTKIRKHSPQCVLVKCICNSLSVWKTFIG